MKEIFNAYGKNLSDFSEKCYLIRVNEKKKQP